MARGAFPILFITSNRIGDAVLSSGLVKRLSDEIPNARFTIVAGPVAAPLFEEVPALDRIIEFAKAKGGGHWFDLWRQVRDKRWGLVVDLRGSGLSRFVSTRRRAIWRKNSGPPVHKVIEAARILKIEDDPAPPYIFTAPQTEARAEELTAGFGPILALAPAANWLGKTWPLERFSRVAMRLLDPEGPMKGGRLMVLGGPEDAKLARELKDVVMRHQFINLTDGVDLLTAYACLKRARLFIGNDSGTMHMAAAAGVPTLGLFGPSDETHYGPWGLHTRVARGPRSFEQIRSVDPGFGQALCHMMDLSVDTVAAAAEELLAATDHVQSPSKTATSEA
ncbi:MAG TPA: glycosyltransferase family 9 protein [Phenylobacterium sp.]|jgi:ADP-heptose:LPS heptosyltransferase|uniref:glycosyltransferase family 9 protein n=1 Tax=Phenylobacterium sp. TaxID=1871053 RepID=UPI002D229253|nr:glycosyltransferase family 9 protein [Phenylobacterium sp.]HZZ69923.1 glycosyltransferase family 9 protein [Phenylobacterium sp.]